MDTQILKEIEEAHLSNRQLIVLIGKKGAGKDACMKTGTDRCNMKIAGTLKLMINCLLFDLGFSGKQQTAMLEGSAKETPQDELFNKSCRQLMQTLGVEWARNTVNGNLWILTFLKRYNRSTFPIIVVTDCRFPNEYEILKELGATFIRITRPSLVSTDEHISETALDGFPVDHEIINDGTIEDLQNKVGAIINGS